PIARAEPQVRKRGHGPPRSTFVSARTTLAVRQRLRRRPVPSRGTAGVSPDAGGPAAPAASECTGRGLGRGGPEAARRAGSRPWAGPTRAAATARVPPPPACPRAAATLI